MIQKIVVFLLVLCALSPFLATAADSSPSVLLAILARNKAHLLPHYLQCIDNLDYEKKKISIYINTNNNEDETAALLEEWIEQKKPLYSKIIYENHHIPNLRITKPHSWTPQRFQVLGEIRNRSLKMAKWLRCAYYFVVDCDNFIAPYTLKELIQKKRPIIAPLLTAIPNPGDTYSNFVCATNDDGYEVDHPEYMKILKREKIGTFQVPIVHCTYLIQADYLDFIAYCDGSPHHEFVIFSRMARKNGIAQYICNEKNFGTLLHNTKKLSLQEEAEQFRHIQFD